VQRGYLQLGLQTVYRTVARRRPHQKTRPEIKLEDFVKDVRGLENIVRELGRWSKFYNTRSTAANLRVRFPTLLSDWFPLVVHLPMQIIRGSAQ
jgi:hypothetical protein